MSIHFQTGGTRLPEASRGDRKTQVGSKKHFTGGAVIGDNHGVRFGLDSHLEKNATMLLLGRSSTLGLREQVSFDWYDEHGVYHTHFIDLVATQDDGDVVGYAVRPMGRVSSEYLAKLARIKEQAIQQCFLDDFLLFTERGVCRVELYNAELFHAVRRQDCFADPVMQDVAGASIGVTTIGDLVDESGLGGMGFRAAVRLIKSGHLQMLRYERIERSSEVYRAHTI
ncbi:MAG: hypothetical protein ABJ360_09605 [Roseobacter sp.]